MTDEEVCAVAKRLSRAATHRAIEAGEASVAHWLHRTGDVECLRAAQKVAIEVALIGEGAFPILRCLRHA